MSQFQEFDKRFGKLPGEDILATHSSNQKDADLIANFIAFIFQLLFTGPNRNWKNPLAIIALGFIFLTINLYFLFNPYLIEYFFINVGFENTMLKLMTGLVCIGVIVQCVRGIWIIGGWNQHPEGGYQYVNVPKSGYIRKGDSRAYYTINSNVLPDAIGETYSWMNSKMQSMTNNQREKYLRGFHGGKK